MSSDKKAKKTAVTELLKDWRTTAGLSQRQVDQRLKGRHASSRYTQQIESGRVLPDREACESLCEVFDQQFDALWGQVIRVKAGSDVVDYFEQQIEVANQGEFQTAEERELFDALRKFDRHFGSDVTAGLKDLLMSSINMRERPSFEGGYAAMEALSKFLALYKGLPMDVQRIVLEDCESAARRATQILYRGRISISVAVEEDSDAS